MGDNDKKQYPGYFKKKKVRVEKTSGIVVGTLRDIVEHHGNLFLVVELATGQDQIINSRHVISIEEGVN